MLALGGSAAIHAQTARAKQSAALQVDSSAPGSVRGMITASDTNLPLAEATVELRTLSSVDSRTHRVVTGPDGQFSFTGVPAGEYVLSARRPGFGPRIYYPMAGVSSFAVRDRQGPPIQMSMTREPAVGGQVVGPGGDPLRGATVVLSHYKELGGRRVLAPEREVTADPQGRFYIPGVSDGKYLFSAGSRAIPAHGNLNALYAHTFYPGTTSISRAEYIAVTGGQSVQNLKIQVGVSPAFSIAGRLTDPSGSPLADITVLARRYIDDGAASLVGMDSSVAKTNAKGDFWIGRLPNGKYRVSVLATMGDRKWVASRTIELQGANSGRFTLVADAGATLSGRVVLEENVRGVPANVVRLTLQAWDEPGIRGMFRANANADGSFEIRGIPDGPAKLTGALNSESYYVKAIRLNGDDVADRAILFANGQTVSGVELVIALDAAELRGSVVSTESTAAAPATVVLFPVNPDLWQTNARLIKVARAAERGEFVIRGIMPGDYGLVALDKAPDAIDPTVLAAIAPSADKIALRGTIVGKRVLHTRTALAR
jgi:hypothetical protein